MKHLSHPHELSAAPMVSNHEIPCFGCKLPLFGSLYGCTGCNFYLHKFCFDLPQSIHSKSHTEHSLGLLFPPYCNGTCDACGESCNGFTYNCNLCNYNVHANCSTLLESEPKNDHDHEYFSTFLGFKLSKLKSLSATNDVGWSSTNKHFSHPHTLNLLEPLGVDKYYEETMIITCSVCEQLIPVNSGAAYACPNRVCDFIFHKSCFDTPRTILNHKSHPDHPLTLIPNQTEQCCTACGGIINGFYYGCSKKCINFMCHVKCTSLPEYVDCKRHNHPLSLRYGTADEYKLCDVCNGYVMGCHWSYSCKDCDFDAHTECAFSADAAAQEEEEEEDTLKQFNLNVYANDQELNYEEEKARLRQMERENELSQMRHKLCMQRIKNASDSIDFMGTIGTGWKYEYRYI